jgi:polysaccharide chain length determinant protein (PEP-CTERM system associated)
MQEKPESIQIAYYLDVLLKRRWYIIIPFCIIVIAGMIATVRIPKLYKATTLILVQAQRVPSEYVQPLMSTELESKIASISQQITSRSNLEQVISKFKLFSGPEEAKMFMEDKIAILRKNISIEVFSDRNRRTPAEAFSVSFKGKDPEMVMRVTNDLAESFINQNLRIREEEAVGTSDFLEDQLVLTRIRLEELEQQLKTFRMENMGGLPEQLETNLRILDRLQMQYDQKQQNLREAKQRQVLLNNQLSELQGIQQTIAGYSQSGAASAQNDPYVQLLNMKQELDQLTGRYTEHHPDVLKLKQMVKNLEEQIETGTAASSAKRPSDTSKPLMHPVLLDRQHILVQQRNEIKLEIQTLEAENQKLVEQIANYQALVEETPKREQALIALKRDYENIQKSYNSLLEKRMQAQLAVNLEKTKRGEQFRILDRAQLPAKPSEPDMKKIFMLTMAAALGLGCGIVFLLEFMDTSIKQKKDVESTVDIPILVSIPRIETEKDRAWTRINNIITVCSLVFAMILCSGFGLMVLKGG